MHISRIFKNGKRVEAAFSSVVTSNVDWKLGSKMQTYFLAVIFEK